MEQALHLNRPSNTTKDLIAEQVARELQCGRIVGEFLTRWRQAQGISYAETWKTLKISALEYRSWENGSVSPQCSKFFDVVQRLGPEACFEADMIVNELMNEGQRLRGYLTQAQGRRWDLDPWPPSAALGAVRKWAA